MSTALSTFNFHGDPIECIPTGDLLWVGVRGVCEGIGIDRANQQEKLAEKSWAITRMVKTTTADGRERDVFCIDLDSLPMWLATIDERRVPEEIRPKLIRYQREAKKALADFFFKKTDPRDALIAQLRAQLAQRPAPALRPTDIAAAWAKAHLEVGKEPMLLLDIWPRYVEWTRAAGQPMPTSMAAFGGGLALHFHRARLPGIGSRSAFYCVLRAEPLAVELPAVQQELPGTGPQQLDEIRAQVRAYFEGQGPRPMAETEMADLLDRVTRVLERNELEAAHVAEVLAAQPMPVQAVLGAGVETGRFTARAKGGRLLYRAVEREAEPQLTDIQRQVKGYMETRPEGERITTREVVEALGLTTDKATEVRVGMALRSLGYQRDRRHDGSGWRRYFYSKPGQAN